MSPAILLLLALGLGLAGWLAARARAWTFRRESADGRLASLPTYHAWYVALWIVLPVLAFVALWGAIAPGLVSQSVLADPAAADLPVFGFERQTILNEARAVATGAAPAVFNPQAAALVEPYRDALSHYNLIGIAVTVLIAFLGGAYAFLRLRPDFAARTKVERIVMSILLGASLVAILTTIGILASLIFETVRFFGMVSPIDFLFGTHWGPDPMANPDNPDPSRYGAVPLFWGTLFIGAIIAMIVAIPLGLMSAIYLTQYANPRLRKWIKPALEILAGVPTVVYGFFALLTVGPFLRQVAMMLGYEDAVTQSALSAGLVMGVMIIPFVSSLSDDVINAVPQALRDGSYAMGATKSETVRHVVFPAALPGIVGALLLAVSRAVGETMIVVMAAGQGANLTANPLESVTTITVQIVMLLTGDQEFDSPKTLSAFALGLVLFIMTLILNIIALRVVQRFRERYE